MINDMNAFELSDEQLAEVAGAGGSLVNITVAPQVNISNQVTTVYAPATGIVTSVGGNAGLQQLGSEIKAGNGSLLGNAFKLK